jgi:hypothetical protein
MSDAVAHGACAYDSNIFYHGCMLMGYGAVGYQLSAVSFGRSAFSCHVLKKVGTIITITLFLFLLLFFFLQSTFWLWITINLFDLQLF